ncbi:Hypothetical predicted protein [Mytilus galloprovincialis]|uniref:Uncharacterized protein n=1 Tax=Mytilus galloprovincialis TaxID=29158 RepID=A0A8B6CKD5_MYTGA|nr:Hypothetical predicted protein [Mytilus galloprovincialis]
MPVLNQKCDRENIWEAEETVPYITLRDIEDDGVIVGNDGDLGETFNGHQDGRAVRDHISTTFFNQNQNKS